MERERSWSSVYFPATALSPNSARLIFASLVLFPRRPYNLRAWNRLPLPLLQVLLLLFKPITWYTYLKYLLHFWRKITDFSCLLQFSTPFSKRMLYFDPSEFLIPVFFFRFTLTSRNCLISFKMRPRKNTKIAHSRPLNGMLDVSRQRAKWKPSSTR